MQADLNLLSLLDNAVEIEALTIVDTKFTIRRDLGDAETNLQTALRRLFPPRDVPGKPINLALDRLDLENISFVQNDSVRGERIDISLESAVVRMDRLDLAGQVIAVDNAEIRQPGSTPDQLRTYPAH